MGKNGHILPGRFKNPEGNWLNKYDDGGTTVCPEGYVWDKKLKTCVKLYTDFGEFKIANQAYQDSLDVYNKTRDIQNPKYYTDGDPSYYTWKGNIKDLKKFERKNNIDWNYEYYRTLIKLKMG